MLHILGIGSAYPRFTISNELLEELDSGIKDNPAFAQSGVRSRLSCLPPEYLKSTRNADVRLAKDHASVSPTDLVYEAVKIAVQRSGIRADEIGLILGECSTPLETIPVESQRLGQRLGIKIPAYDIFTSAASFALHLDTIESWSEDKLPDYILCISSNLLTQRVDYSSGNERIFMGDAASAMVVSVRKTGKLRVARSFYGFCGEDSSVITTDLFGHIKVTPWPDREQIIRGIEAVHDVYSAEKPVKYDDLKLIAGQIDPGVFGRLAQIAGIKEQNHWFNADINGANPCSAPMCILADKWDNISGNDKILVLMAGFGLSHGFVLLES